MTTEAAAPAETTESTTTETASPEGLPPAEDIGAKYRDVLAAMDGDKPVEKQADAEDKPADKTVGEEKPAEEEPAPEEPEKKKDDGKLELQLARAQREIKRVTTESLKDKASAKESAAALDKLKQAIRTDFIQAALDETGLPVGELFKRAQAGSTADPLAGLPDSVRATLEWAEKAKKIEADRQESERLKAQRTADSATLKAFLTENEAKFDLLDTSDDTASWLLEEVYAWMKENPGKQPDLEELTATAEAHTQKTLETLLSNERVVRKLAAVQPVRELFTKVLGTPIQQQSPTSSKGAVVTKIPSASPEVTRASEPDDTTDLVRGLEEFRRKQALGR